MSKPRSPFVRGSMKNRKYIPGNRLYRTGFNTCGECNLGRHRACRPKLDGSLCSCACPRAIEIRTEYDQVKVDAEEALLTPYEKLRQTEYFERDIKGMNINKLV